MKPTRGQRNRVFHSGKYNGCAIENYLSPSGGLWRFKNSVSGLPPERLLLKFTRHAAVLEKVEIGECTNCGERYYPAATSERLQERINELLDSRTITASDQKKIDIFSAQHAIVNNFDTIDQLTQRVVALESSLKTLTATEAHPH